MKLLAFLLVLMTFAGAISEAKKVERGNVGAAIGLNIAATTPTAYPTIPSFINQLTSQLFNPNMTSGESAVYSLLKQLSSNIFPFLANTTYGILQPLNNFINGVTSNLYNGLCAPPRPNYTNPLGPILGGATLAPPTGASAPVNPLTNIFNFLNGNGGNTGTPGTSATDPISQIINALTGAAGNSASSISTMLNTISGALGQHFGNDAGNLQTLINSLLGTAAGATSGTATTAGTDPLTALLNSLGGLIGAGTGTGTSGATDPLSALLNSLGLGGATGTGTTGTGTTGTGTGGVNLSGLFPGVTVTGTVNTTLNLSPLAFNQLLASIGQNIPTLQAALTKLSATAQQFVNGLAVYNGNVLAYLQAIFTQASTPTSTGGTITLQDLLNNVLNNLNNALSGTGLISTLDNLLQSLLG